MKLYEQPDHKNAMEYCTQCKYWYVKNKICNCEVENA